jgi:hypothetical protein
MPDQTRILIAEDDHEVVELVRVYLEKEGFQVAAAGDGAGGTLEKTLQHDPAAQRVGLPTAGPGGDPARVLGPRINGRVCGTDIARGIIDGGRSRDGSSCTGDHRDTTREASSPLRHRG